MNYAMVETGNGVMGMGFNPIGENFPAGTISFYVGTDNIDATLAEAEKLGAETITPKSEIPGMGWFAFFKDLSGNMVGLYTAMPRE
jgi:predicted enzyme related to lactoylglutathione lyase